MCNLLTFLAFKRAKALAEKIDNAAKDALQKNNPLLYKLFLLAEKHKKLRRPISKINKWFWNFTIENQRQPETMCEKYSFLVHNKKIGELAILLSDLLEI